MNQTAHNTTTGGGFAQTASKAAAVETHLYEGITLSSYVCDFGNVVINSLKTKTIKIINAGPISIDFSIDSKNFRNQGFLI